MENLRIIWDEITKAVEPITFDIEGYFNLIKPFKRTNPKTGRPYDFYYIDLEGKGSSFNNSIISVIANFYRMGYLGSLSALCLDNNYNNIVITFSHIDNNVNKIRFNQFKNSYFQFYKIKFYGGYISK